MRKTKKRGVKKNNMQKIVRTISRLQKDFVAGFLRSQIVILERMLNEIEHSDRVKNNNVKELLSRVEKEFCRFRKIICE